MNFILVYLFVKKVVFFKYIYNKVRNPTSLCELRIKEISSDIQEENYTFNVLKKEKEKEKISNINTLSCFKEVSKKF